ncbi:hypothetical protein C8T65DRAFT_286143 [Cerioporus squamosus]|nr:hypothetical protein C8T65DRAFT_286143 [Cerioporus squamosus]
MGPLERFSFKHSDAIGSVALYNLLALFPSIVVIVLKSNLWSDRRSSDDWRCQSSELAPSNLAVDILYVFNLPWRMILAMVHYNSTMSRTITSLRLNMLLEYYPPAALGAMLAGMPSLRHVQISPYVGANREQLWAEHPQGQAYKALSLFRCQRLEIAEFNLSVSVHATDTLEQLEQFMDADLPASTRQMRISFFEVIPWCCGAPKSQADLASWAQLDRRMLEAPSHVRFRVSFTEPSKERMLHQAQVDGLRAFFGAVLPGVTARGRLSVMHEAPVSVSAPRGCTCTSCVMADGL